MLANSHPRNAYILKHNKYVPVFHETSIFFSLQEHCMRGVFIEMNVFYNTLLYYLNSRVNEMSVSIQQDK